MVVNDNGGFVTVTATAQDVRDFKSRWPCSGLPAGPIYFQFDKASGDLVDLWRRGEKSLEYDGEDLVALSQDAWGYYAKK